MQTSEATSALPIGSQREDWQNLINIKRSLFQVGTNTPIHLTKTSKSLDTIQEKESFLVMNGKVGYRLQMTGNQTDHPTNKKPIFVCEEVFRFHQDEPEAVTGSGLAGAKFFFG